MRVSVSVTDRVCVCKIEQNKVLKQLWASITQLCNVLTLLNTDIH